MFVYKIILTLGFNNWSKVLIDDISRSDGSALKIPVGNKVDKLPNIAASWALSVCNEENWLKVEFDSGFTT